MSESRTVTYRHNGEWYTAEVPDDGTLVTGKKVEASISGKLAAHAPFVVRGEHPVLMIIDDPMDPVRFETMKHNTRVAKEQHALVCPGEACEICASAARLKERYYPPYHHEDLAKLLDKADTLGIGIPRGHGKALVLDSLGRLPFEFPGRPFGMGDADKYTGPARTPGYKPSRWLPTPEQKRAKRKERKAERQARRRQRRA